MVPLRCSPNCALCEPFLFDNTSNNSLCGKEYHDRTVTRELVYSQHVQMPSALLSLGKSTASEPQSTAVSLQATTVVCSPCHREVEALASSILVHVQNLLALPTSHTKRRQGAGDFRGSGTGHCGLCNVSSENVPWDRWSGKQKNVLSRRTDCVRSSRGPSFSERRLLFEYSDTTQKPQVRNP